MYEGVIAVAEEAEEPSLHATYEVGDGRAGWQGGWRLVVVGDVPSGWVEEPPRVAARLSRKRKRRLLGYFLPRDIAAIDCIGAEFADARFFAVKLLPPSLLWGRVLATDLLVDAPRARRECLIASPLSFHAGETRRLLGSAIYGGRFWRHLVLGDGEGSCLAKMVRVTGGDGKEMGGDAAELRRRCGRDGGSLGRLKKLSGTQPVDQVSELLVFDSGNFPKLFRPTYMYQD